MGKKKKIGIRAHDKQAKVWITEHRIMDGKQWWHEYDLVDFQNGLLSFFGILLNQNDWQA